MKILRQKIFILFFFLAFVSSSALAEGSITVDSQVDRSTILIGDVFRYSVIITHDPDVKIQSPSLGANLGQFEIRDYKVLEPVKTDSQIVEQTDYTLSTFDTGEFEIPPLKIDFTTAADSTVQSIKTKPIKITVQSLNPDQAGDIRDIKPPLEPAKQYGRIILLASIILAALLLALFIFYYIKRRKAGKSLIPRKEKPSRPAHEIALEALEKLVQSDLLAAGKVKEYYIELSDIIRQYIGNRFYIYAMEMTTSQLLDE
ncbi:MAG: protein BatD, partial [Calditrichaeota bacterium]|nr:protein BatD [Calditrichota bacterium]